MVQLSGLNRMGSDVHEVEAHSEEVSHIQSVDPERIELSYLQQLFFNMLKHPTRYKAVLLADLDTSSMISALLSPKLVTPKILHL